MGISVTTWRVYVNGSEMKVAADYWSVTARGFIFWAGDKELAWFRLAVVDVVLDPSTVPLELVDEG